MRILRTTIAKQSTVQSSQLLPQHKTELESGEYRIERWEPAPNNHYRVTFANKISGYQTWILWGDDVLFDETGMFIKVNGVPYYSQRDNTSDEWWRQCNSSSHAMLLNYLKPGSVASDDDYIRRFVDPIGDTTDWSIHTKALRQFGIESVYRQNLDFVDLERSLLLGFPVVIGVLHNGPITAPSGGHVLIITGIDKVNSLCYANDPWGTPFSYTNHNGRDVQIPFYPSLDRRWLVDGDRSGWGRIVVSVDGKTKL